MNTGGLASEKTLLDEFAGQALQGLLACPVGSGRAVENAASAYDHATAMLAEKARREGVSEIAPKDSDNRVIRVGWSLFSIADEALDSNDESRCFLHDWKEAVKDHREVVVQESSTTDNAAKVAELQAANRELVEALEKALGCIQETRGPSAYWVVRDARAILSKHKGAA